MLPNSLAQTGWLKQLKRISHISGGWEIPDGDRYKPIQFLIGTLLLASRCHLLTAPSPAERESKLSGIPDIMRTLVLLDQSSTLVASWNFNHFLNPCTATLADRTSTYTFGGAGHGPNSVHTTGLSQLLPGSSEAFYPCPQVVCELAGSKWRSCEFNCNLGSSLSCFVGTSWRCACLSTLASDTQQYLSAMQWATDFPTRSRPQHCLSCNPLAVKSYYH